MIYTGQCSVAPDYCKLAKVMWIKEYTWKSKSTAPLISVIISLWRNIIVIIRTNRLTHINQIHVLYIYCEIE